MKDKISDALIGGFAVGVWGVVRSTVDLDFIAHKDDLGKIDNILGQMDYELRYRSENVSQYLSPLKVFGEIDFLHVHKEAGLAILTRANEKKIFNESFKIKVAIPEDLIGLKLQAITNDEKRKELDFNDIKELITQRKSSLDWKLIEYYFTLFDAKDIFDKLRNEYRWQKR